jgi:hypothetical protein
VRAKRYKAQLKHLMFQHKIVNTEIKQPIEKNIAHTRNAIAKKLQRNKSSEGWIKKIDNDGYPAANCFEELSHDGLISCE